MLYDGDGARATVLFRDEWETRAEADEFSGPFVPGALADPIDGPQTASSRLVAAHFLRLGEDMFERADE